MGLSARRAHGSLVREFITGLVGHAARRREAGARTARWGVRSIALAALGAVGLIVAGVPSIAQTLASLPSPATVGRLDGGGTARPVAAWVKFCERYAGECNVNTAQAESITLTARVWRALNTVNRQVNASIKPMTDLEHWGIVDRWDIPTDGYGDCEDYQILKRKILVEKYGLPRRAMRMTVVIDEQGEGHAVLTVRTDEGDLILDNKRSGILPWHQTGYVYVSAKGRRAWPGCPLGDRSSPVTTANR